MSAKPAVFGMLAEQDGICPLCDRRINPNRTGSAAPTIDHIVPKARGGANARSNMQIVHRQCNRLKADMTQDEFDRWKAAGMKSSERRRLLRERQKAREDFNRGSSPTTKESAMSEDKQPDRVDIRIRRKTKNDPVSWQIRINRSFLEGAAPSTGEAITELKSSANAMGWDLELAPVSKGDAGD